VSSLDDAIAQGQQTLANSKAVSESRALQTALRHKPRNEVTFLLEGREVPILNAKISRSIDTVADGWTCEVEWIPGRDKDLDRRIGPYTYARAQIYIGPRLVNTGRLYTVRNTFTAQGLVKQLECASYTADLVDSDMPPFSGYQFQGSSLPDIASTLCRQMKNVDGSALTPPISVGISRILTGADYTRVVTPFDIVQTQLTEKYSEFFTRLAYQRGALVTNDRYGMLLITMGAKTGPEVATLGEQDIAAYRQALAGSNAQSQSWGASFDGRQRFSTYAVYGQSGAPLEYDADESEDTGGAMYSVATDDRVPGSRRTNIIMGDIAAGGAGVTAAWHRSRQLVKALTIPFPVIGWYTPAGELWNPNDFVTALAPSLDINIATHFLVRQIDYDHSASGQTATLYLVPPEVYTGQPVREPWSGRWQ